MNRVLLAVCLTAVAALARPALAGDSAGGATGSPRETEDVEQDADIAWIERSRAGLHQFTESIGRGVDGWFGDIPFEQGGRLVNGRLGIHGLWRRDDGFQMNVRFTGKFDLPNLQNKAYLYFGQDNERELITDQPEAFTRQQRLKSESRQEDQTFFAGLGYAVRENIDLRGGIRGGLNPYVQARYSKKWSFVPEDQLEFRETLFWEVKEGLGLTTALYYAHALSRSVDLRWRNAATISQSTDALAWQSSLGLFVSFGDLRQVALETLVNGETGSPVRVAEYGLRATYRQPVYKDWLLGELIVGHFWPKESVDAERERSWAAGAGVEIRF